MKVSDRLKVIDHIGRELQSRFTYTEINTYLAAFGVKPPSNIAVNSKWVYTKEALKNVSLETLAKIVEDLNLPPLAQAAAQLLPPKNWKDTRQFRLFICHVAKDKDKATRLRETLSPYAINAFVAHEDIHPTSEWQTEIERALFCMDAFLAIHTDGFSKSFWTQQEIGFAVARGVKIISFKMGEDPTGFISKLQALPRLNRTAEQVAQEIDLLLSNDPLTKDRLERAKQETGTQDWKEEIPF